MIVISDTSPLHYLVLIQAESVLPKLYGRVLIPEQVLLELQHEQTPAQVRLWMEALPDWLEVHPVVLHAVPEHLQAGELAAVALAKATSADLLLVDDLDARRYATQEGVSITGTLGVLRDAARKHLIDIHEALAELRMTGFRAAPDLYQQVLDEFSQSNS
jgi:predicted nucleic acid-binding protein